MALFSWLPWNVRVHGVAVVVGAIVNIDSLMARASTPAAMLEVGMVDMGSM